MPVFGDKARFAVEFSVNQDHGGVWLFGRMCFWLFGSMVGDFELGTSLRDALFQIEHVLRDRGRRNSPSLMQLPAATVARMLNEGLFLGTNPASESAALREEWARHSVAPSLDVFSGWKIFLIESTASARLIAQRHEQPATEYSLGVGEFDQVLAATQTALNELYESNRAKPNQ